MRLQKGVSVRIPELSARPSSPKPYAGLLVYSALG